MKEHEFRELVNALRDTALQYHDHESLRDRIASVLEEHEVGPSKMTATPLLIDWQPIDTAPKDNRRPLLLASFNDDGTMQSFDYNASWEKDYESWEMPTLYWYWQSENGYVEEPTHWAYQPDNFDRIHVESHP